MGNAKKDKENEVEFRVRGRVRFGFREVLLVVLVILVIVALLAGAKVPEVAVFVSPLLASLR